MVDKAVSGRQSKYTYKFMWKKNIIIKRKKYGRQSYIW